MATKQTIAVHQVERTRILPTEELNARRRRKALTSPLDPPNHTVEPARRGRRTVDAPSTQKVSCQTVEVLRPCK